MTTGDQAMKSKNHRSRRTSTRGRASEAFVPRLRIRVQNDLVLGPGKIELLQAIERTGSISAAGREMGMSYRRAWLLADALNRMFDCVLIRTSAGGVLGGGAQVTEFGRSVVAAYRRAEERTGLVIRDEF